MTTVTMTIELEGIKRGNLGWLYRALFYFYFGALDSSVPLMHHDPSDLESLILIWIIPKERTLIISSCSVQTPPTFGSTNC